MDRFLEITAVCMFNAEIRLPHYSQVWRRVVKSRLDDMFPRSVIIIEDVKIDFGNF